MVYSRDKIIAFNRNYRGSVDERQVELEENNDMMPGEGVHPNARGGG